MSESPQQPNAAMCFARALKRHGVEYIFGQSNPPFLTYMAEQAGIKQIGYRQENTGSYMADGYGRMSGKIPVITAQNGAAATLLVPGLAECLAASTPIVAMVQDVSLTEMDKNAFQELDHVALYQGCAKWIKRVNVGDRIEEYIDKAFVAAGSGKPGPAVLLLPGDVVNNPAPVNAPERTANLGHWPLDRAAPDPDSVEAAAALLAQSEKPVVLSGGGTMSSRAQAELRELQDVASLPVGTTSMGKGSVDEADSLSMGCLGNFMAERGMAHFLRDDVENADVVLLVGTRTNMNATDFWSMFSPDAKFIHIDIDPNEIGRNYESMRLNGDAKVTLKVLTEAMRKQDLSKRDAARAGVEAKIADAKAKHIEQAASKVLSDAAPIRPERIMHEVEKLLADDHIIVADASLASVWNANFLKATKDRRFIFPRGIAGLGWGAPMAWGAHLAEPERPVFCLVGDGGFAHALSELETARRHSLKAVIVVLNNSILGYQYHGENIMMGAHTTACELTPIDHAGVAEACGVKGMTVRTVDELISALEEAFSYTEGSVVIDAFVDPNALPPVPMFTQSPDY